VSISSSVISVQLINCVPNQNVLSGPTYYKIAINRHNF